MSKILIAKDAAEKAMVAETSRMESLLREAGKLVAGIIIVLGFQLLDAKTLLESTSPWVKILCYASLAALSVSLLFAMTGLRTTGHSNYPRGNKLWDNLKPDTITEEAAEEAIVQMLLKTREQNAILNDVKARWLFWCGRLFVTGVLLVIGSQLLDAYIDTLT
ncbi:MAG TPA: hypothetical protein VMF08_07445 [Candidatus Sulfotelmatobacter sp.]|nr:hypothetical protein [Candidatus Sulfotelmatobacter sp.]